MAAIKISNPTQDSNGLTLQPFTFTKSEVKVLRQNR